MVQPSPSQDMNRAFRLYDWSDRLTAADLSAEDKHSYAVTLRWYFSFCKQQQLRATYQSAKSFLETAKQDKSPPDFAYQK